MEIKDFPINSTSSNPNVWEWELIHEIFFESSWQAIFKNTSRILLYFVFPSKSIKIRPTWLSIPDN